jgi:hypothetical protein
MKGSERGKDGMRSLYHININTMTLEVTYPLFESTAPLK